MDPSLAKTVIAISRQYAEHSCGGIPAHLTAELATIAVDASLAESVRNEALALLESDREGSPQ